jgi:hypothetical protein
LSFVRGSTTTYHSSATATDPSSPSLAGKTVFFGSNRDLNGRSACLGDSGRDTSAEHSVSSGVANARDCGIGYDEFAAYRNGLAKLTKSYRRADYDCGIGYDEFAACRNGLAKFTKCYRRGDSDYGIGYDEFAAGRNGLAKLTKSYRRADYDCGIGYDEFAAGRNGLAKFTKCYRRGDSVRFRCICGDCTAASGYIPCHRHPPRRLSQCPRGSRVGLSGGHEA